MEGHNFTVATRVRPLNQGEKDSCSVSCVEVEGEKIIVHSQDAACKKMEFSYDHAYWSCNSNDPHYAGQARLFEDIGERVVQCTAEGYNSCVFAYGQTGSGKTHTMMGSDDAERGLVPRICQALLDLVQRGTSTGVNHRVKLSYLEIYNEKIRDLLYNRQSEATSSCSGTRNLLTKAKDSSLPPQVSMKLQIRRSKAKGIHVPDLTQVLVSSYEEVEEHLRVGNARRSTAGTRVNAQSSRSHAVLTLTCSQARFTQDVPNEIVSKLHLVDLAGSERVKKTGATGARLTEGRHINRSLSALSNVLYTLSTGGKAAAHVPYRDSLLTQLLQDSLGGNAKTFMIATISPASQNYSESLSTLRYASRAKLIVNTPTINEDSRVKIIRELREQIQSLQSQLQQYKGHQQASETDTDLTQKQQQEQRLTMRWHRRWASRVREVVVRETSGISMELPSPITETSRAVMKLVYPEQTDSGVASPRDSNDEGLDNSNVSCHSTLYSSSFCSPLHDDDETTLNPPSYFSVFSSSSSSTVKSASDETGNESASWFVRHSIPTPAGIEPDRPRPSLPGVSRNESRSICTQTSLDDDRNDSTETQALDKLVHNFSLLERDIDYDATDVSSATDMSNTSLMIPGNASSRKLALIIEKEVQRRLSMSFTNSTFNNSEQPLCSSFLTTSPSTIFSSTLPTSLALTSVASTHPDASSTLLANHSVSASLATPCSISLAGPAYCSRQRSLTVDVSHGYSVDVSSVFRLKGGASSIRYYQVDLSAGTECWKVYKNFSDVVVMKTDLEKKYPALKPVFEHHAALFSRPAEDLKKQPSKQELKMLLCEVLTLFTLPSSSWSPLSCGPPSHIEFTGVHKFFRMGLGDGLRSIMHSFTSTVSVGVNF